MHFIKKVQKGLDRQRFPPRRQLERWGACWRLHAESEQCADERGDERRVPLRPVLFNPKPWPEQNIYGCQSAPRRLRI